jgi:hypothetical protein
MASSYTIVTHLRYVEHVIREITNEVSQRPEMISTDTADSAFYIASVQRLVDRLMALKDMLIRPGLLRVINSLELPADSSHSSDSN